MAFPIGWGRKQKITIQSTYVNGTGSYTDFPLLVTLDHLNSEIVDAASNSGLKAYWEEIEDKRRETYAGLDQNALLALSQDAEIIEATTDDQTGLTDVTVIRSEDVGRVRIENIPPEEFLIQPSSRTIVEADYVAHKCQKTLSDLIEMGFEREMVEGLSAGEGQSNFDGRATERYKDEDYFQGGDNLDKSMRKVWVLEEYVRCDYDGDGIAELRNFQLEPVTLYDLHDNFLQFRPQMRALLDFYQIPTLSLADNLVLNPAYAVAAARLQYFRAPDQIPTSLQGQAKYWKKYWNTAVGKGTAEQYVTHYKHYV